MKRLIFVATVVVLAFGLVFSGCAQPAESELKEANLVITHNTPATHEWGEATRVGVFYMGLITAYEAAQSGQATNIAVVYLPEATDATGALDGFEIPRDLIQIPTLPAEIDTLGKLARHLKAEFGVSFYAWDIALQVHGEITPADFIEPITCSEYAELVTNAGRVVDF